MFHLLSSITELKVFKTVDENGLKYHLPAYFLYLTEDLPMNMGPDVYQRKRKETCQFWLKLGLFWSLWDFSGSFYKKM